MPINARASELKNVTEDTPPQPGGSKLRSYNPLRLALKPGTLLKVLLVLLILLPPLLSGFIIGDLQVNLPFLDEWYMAPLVVKLHTGGLTFNDLWQPHVDHRIVLSRLTILALAKLWGWNMGIEVYFGWASQLATFFLIWRLLVRTVSKNLVLPLTLVAYLFLFSTAQLEVWTFGFDLVWYELNLTFVLAIWLITGWPGRWWSLLLAGGVTLGANFTLISGLLLWPTILAGLLVYRLVYRQGWGWRAIGMWVVAAILTGGAYFYDYHSVTQGHGPLYLLQYPLEVMGFSLAFLGSPLALIWGGQAMCLAYGGAGVVIWLVSAGWLGYRAFKAKDQSWQALLPWLLLTGFVYSNAVLIGTGRVLPDRPFALAGRYHTLPLLFWTGLSVLVALALQRLYQSGQGRRILVIVTCACLYSLPFVPAYFQSYTQSYNLMYQWSRNRETSLYFLHDYSTAASETLLNLYHTVPEVRERAWAIDQVKEGPFSISSQQYQAQLREKWQKRLPSADFTRTLYPPSLLKMIEGDASSLKYSATGLDFVRANSPQVVFEVAPTALKLYQPAWWPFSGERQVLDIQTKSAWFLFVSWNGGVPELAYGLDEVDGWKHFRVSVPPAITSLQITLRYSTTRQTEDSLKLEVFDRR